ncbi:MAG: Gfo/Idh/MocA family oxidoreductase [Thermoplasmata archaeon]|jgi:predicted dehydrogenase|nr:Gfo/Idh/MocA family oxidoreductase [Thermoplasmata archaeon]
MAKFNVGVIGAGYWGRKIVDEFSKVENVNLVGVSDLDEKNLAFCAERFGVKTGYKDYKQLLAVKDLHAVSISTPNALHYQICKDALEAGKHVLVEKPLTLSSAEGKELVELAQKKGLTLSVGHIFRFNNALAEVKRLIKEEKFFGKLFLMELTWTNLEKSFPDRDVLADLAPHMFDIQNYLLGQWPEEISCMGGPFRRDKGEETAYVMARFKDGLIAVSNISWLIPKKTRQILLVGEARSALIDAVAQEVTVYESGYTYRLGVERNNTIRDELVHFVKSISDPMTETKNSGAIGLRTVELIEAAKRSMAEHKAIRV